MHKSLAQLLFRFSDKASSFTPTLIKMAHTHAKMKHWGIDFKTATCHCYSVKLSNCFQTWPTNREYLSLD